MVEINIDQFKSMPQEQKDAFLFENVCGTQGALMELKEGIDALLKSPWRMAVPPVSWKAIGLFILLMTAVIRGDGQLITKLFSAIMGL